MEDSNDYDWRDRFRRETNAAYGVWESLRGVLEKEYDLLTVPNILEGIRKGVGEDLVLKLQALEKMSEKDTSKRVLGSIMPTEVRDAILNYEAGS
jgi:hypothetical protein